MTADSSKSSMPKIDVLMKAVNVSAANEEKDEKQSDNKVFIAKNMSDAVRNAQYAVRGLIVQRAHQIKADLATDKADKYPFKSLVFCNIGNPQAFCPPPITFHRQVLSCIMYPPLMDNETNKFPKDVILRANGLLDATSHRNIGAYTMSKGLEIVRKSVASYLAERDGFAANPDHIYLTNGASAGITYALKCLISSKSDGILVPIPQYPLYSATITLNAGNIIPYYLDEENDWNASLESIEEAIVSAKTKNLNIRGIVVINPGNPTGQCMNKKCIDGIIDIANKYNIVILADEVYQENIYYVDKYPFISFRKCLLSSADKDRIKTIELMSFHSVSKGIFGECGLRGGYMELINIDKSGMDIITKLASINLCPNTIGQCMVDLMVSPPKNGDPSYELFQEEYKKQYESLQERAKILTEELNKIDGITCNTVYGAMYAFPNIKIPEIAVKTLKNEYKNDAEYNTKEVDFIYCMELLENYGICVVPGSGFGQKNGTFHFRTTLLPPKGKIKRVVQSIGAFHQLFIRKYSSS